jgi:hypothetical protein
MYMRVPMVGPSAPEVTAWPNPRPDRQLFFVTPYALLGYLAFVVALSVVATFFVRFSPNPSAPIIFSISFLSAGFLAVFAMEQNFLWNHTPDRVQIESDRVIGIFDPHIFVRRQRVVKQLPFSAVSKEVPGIPGLFSLKRPIIAVWAESLVVPAGTGTSPPTGWGDLAELPGFAARLNLNMANYSRFKLARELWSAKVTTSGGQT